MKFKFNRRVLLILNVFSFCILLFAAERGTQAATYTVTNTNNSGAGSLRQAILDANLNHANDTIVFNIPGAGVKTITPSSNLPDITDALIIDGTSQPNYSATPLIEINATNMSNGLKFDGISGVDGFSAVVKGLIINRASQHGIWVNGDDQFPGNGNISIEIYGCYIGTNSSGTADLGNGGSGIYIRSPDDSTGGMIIIGGAAASQRNVISGNNGYGIYSIGSELYITGSSIRIYNNYIGTNAAGTADLGNSEDGILHENGGDILIGGTGGFGFNLGNVISGNNDNGIVIGFGPESCVIKRNYIGTNAAGTGALGNSKNGIVASRCLIGSSTSALDGNVISGNGGGSVEGGKGLIIGYDAQVFGNKIGTNASGTAALPNESYGIQINSSSNQIGLAGNNTARNIVAGNNLHGIVLNDDSATGNEIENNFIGTNTSGANLGNGGHGILITGATTPFVGANYIGGLTSSAGNTIAYNYISGVSVETASSGNQILNNTIHHNVNGSGVSVSSPGSTGNRIRQNAIYSNQGFGINLGAGGVTPNDLNDADAGANNLQNFPVLQSATPTRIAGVFNSLPDQVFLMDVYRVDSCDYSNHGQGRYHLFAVSVTTVGNNASFNFSYSGLTVGQIITATVTDSSGNTSEFSQCRTVTPETGDVRLSSATYNVSETDAAAIITVNRIGGSTGTISVDYATSGGTAIAGQDYIETIGTLTFASGETSKTFAVPIINDIKDEPGETFNVALSNPAGGAILLSPSSAVVTVNDNDDPPTVSISDVALKEGNSGTTNFTFTVSLSAASAFDVSVSYATQNGTATAGIDYSAASGALNFSSALGETGKTVTIAVSGDTTTEINETFFVYLSNPVNATVSDAQGIGTILDDDNPGKLQFQMSPYYTGENTNLQIIVVRMDGVAGTVTVDYATGGGTATPNVDYTPATGTLIFNDGETTKSYSIPILSDTEAEGQENFGIVLSNPLGGATLGSLSSTTVNIGIPTASSVTVTGRVMSAQGRGIRNALVTLTAADGETRTVLTGTFGYYRFPDVQGGETYVLTVRSKRFEFASQVVNVTEEINELNFTANN